MQHESVTPVKHSAFHRKHIALNASMFNDEGWIRPARYLMPDEEVARVLRTVGVCDISPFGKIDVKGSDTEAFLEQTLSLSLTPRRPGEVRIMETRHAGEEPSQSKFFGAEVQYVCRLARDHALVITTPSLTTTSPFGLERSVRESTGRAYLTNVTSAFAGLTVAGPASRELLSKLTPVDLSPNVFSNPACAEGSLAKIHALLVRYDARYGSGDVASYDVYFGRAYGEYVWDALADAGREFGLIPFGATGRDLFRRSSVSSTNSGVAAPQK